MALVKVAVDAMGGDNAPGEIIKGALSALSSLDDLELVLVGRRQVVSPILARADYPKGRVELVHAEEVIEGDDDPSLSVRRKKDSSMVRVIQMVADKKADAAVSAGNTGALMAASLLYLGRIEGIDRPALLTPMPSFGEQPVIFLDVGANMDARAGQYLQYGFMGRLYAQKVLGIANPKIGLLNVGTEANKGNAQTKKAFSILEEHLPGFYGNIEGTDLFYNVVDVVVCDGFVGNIFLKTTEGLSRAILNYFKQGIETKLLYKVGALLLQPVFLGLLQKVDASGFGGAPLLGVNGLCIKCHGSSKARSIEQALIRQAYPFVSNKVTTLLLEALKDLLITPEEGGLKS